MTSLLSRKTLKEFGFPEVCVHMAYCKETGSVLLCTKNTIEYCHSSSSNFSLQPQKTLKLDKESTSISVHIAKRMGGIFVGCEGDEGIHVFDGKSHQLIKKFAQDMERDFNFIVVDETEDPQCCTVYTTSILEGLLTKLDYNSGSILSELSVEDPVTIILKDDKLYVICAKKSEEFILVVDKCSLKIQSKFELSNWSKLGGLCLDESGNVCVTAFDKSKQRFIYSFDDGGNIVRQIPLSDLDKDEEVLEMVFVDKDMIMLTVAMSTVDPDEPEWALNRFKLN